MKNLLPGNGRLASERRLSEQFNLVLTLPTLSEVISLPLQKTTLNLSHIDKSNVLNLLDCILTVAKAVFWLRSISLSRLLLMLSVFSSGLAERSMDSIWLSFSISFLRAVFFVTSISVSDMLVPSSEVSWVLAERSSEVIGLLLHTNSVKFTFLLTSRVVIL